MIDFWSLIIFGGNMLLYCFVMVLMMCSCVKLDGILGDFVVEYYVQCVLFGLLIIEGMQFFDDG